MHTEISDAVLFLMRRSESMERITRVIKKNNKIGEEKLPGFLIIDWLG